MKAKALLPITAAVVFASCSVSEIMPESPEEKLASAIETAAEKKTESVTLADPDELYGFIPETPASAAYFLENCSDDVRGIYMRLYSGIFNHDTEIKLPSGVIGNEDFSDLLSMTVMTSPWSDAMDSKYSVSIASDETVESLTAAFSGSSEDSKEHYDAVVKRAYEIAEQAVGYDSDYEKLCYIHDTIIFGCQYEPSAPDAHSAYGALIGGKAVCEGYAKAFSLICELSGITALPVSGIAVSPESGSQPHMWNKVLLDGEWYNVDVTWDDPTGSDDPLNIRYDYLLVSDEYISASHTEKKNVFMPEPAAGNSFGSWYYRTGNVITADTDIGQVAARFLNGCFYSGSDRTLRIYCEDSETYERVCDEWFGEGSGSFKSMLTSYASLGESISYSFSNEPRTRVITVTIL
ncbi:Transglutaminase-like superfamily protein [Ruminococcus sp. YE71]|uniref:transglutaminase domain-containing protein n=1 Tax=unclassified Ruminococcus TaxID=2608920 RepID=UPI00088D7D2A|nr:MULTISPECIES: transglutaminase domain-containing protein [unclassified Ruminococcus]SDA12400.1 Transglutaminase-like superfamily protein [Ruminococcus sp. YE78]SFW16851.1 Transglutaminase-like superfamily protein [Ruminococcus sp. YE71]